MGEGNGGAKNEWSIVQCFCLAYASFARFLEGPCATFHNMEDHELHLN